MRHEARVLNSGAERSCAQMSAVMQTKHLWILAAMLISLAFVLRAIIPHNRFLPGGWPLGSHWYRTVLLVSSWVWPKQL